MVDGHYRTSREEPGAGLVVHALLRDRDQKAICIDLGVSSAIFLVPGRTVTLILVRIPSHTEVNPDPHTPAVLHGGGSSVGSFEVNVWVP